MGQIRRPMPLLTVALPNLGHLTFVQEDITGRIRAWDITLASQVVADGRQPQVFSLSAHAVTEEFLREYYDGIDFDYARSCDLSKPILAVPQGDKITIIDGWHRLARAVLEEEPELPMHLLTQEEADAVLWLDLPPGSGVIWK